MSASNPTLEQAVFGVLLQSNFHRAQDGSIFPGYLNAARQFHEEHGSISLFSQPGYDRLWKDCLDSWATGLLPSYSNLSGLYEERTKTPLPELTDLSDLSYAYNYSLSLLGETGTNIFVGMLFELRQLAVQRRIKKEMERLSAALDQPSGPGWTAERMRDRLTQLLELTKDGPAQEHRPESLMTSIYKQAEFNERVQSGEETFNLIQTGDRHFDNLVSFLRGHIAVVMSGSGWGKTTWTSWYHSAIVRHALAHGGQPISTLTLSYEVPENQMASRLIAQVSSTDTAPFSAGAVSTGRLSPAKLNLVYKDLGEHRYDEYLYQFYKTLEPISGQRGYTDYGAAVLSQVQGQILAWIEDCRSSGYDPAVVTLDYLGTLLGAIPQNLRIQAGEAFVIAMRRFAQEHNLLIILVSQVTNSMISDAARTKNFWFGATHIEWYKGCGKVASYIVSLLPMHKAFGRNDPFIQSESPNSVHLYVSKNSIGSWVPSSSDATGVLPMEFDPVRKSYQTPNSYCNPAIFGREQVFDGSRLLTLPTFSRNLYEGGDRGE